jgi:DNA-binding beta-propeller fold protein YncE
MQTGIETGFRAGIGYWLTVAALVCAIPNSVSADLLLAGFAADAVVRYNDSGELVGVFASHATMNGPTAMVYNTAGDLLVLNEFSLNVLRFDGATGAFLGTFISSADLGSVGIGDPSDMEIGPDGNLYITNHFNTAANIWRFDGSTGAYLGTFAFNPPTHHSHGLAMGPGGDWFAGHVDAGIVERYDGVSGVFEGVFTSGPVFPIADLAFGPSHLFMTLDGSGGVARFDATTGAFTDFLIAPGAFESYWGILVDDGILYVANKATGTVKKFDATSGAFIEDFIIGGPGAFDLLPMSAIPEPSCLLAMAATAASVVFVRRRKLTI